MKRMALLSLGASTLLTACHQAAPTSPAAQAGAAGIYQGLLPCADCAGIQTTLYLFPDSTFEETMLYLGKTTPTTFVAGGRWVPLPSSRQVRLIRPNNGGPDLYTQTPYGLQQLDLRGQPVTGALAGRYFLSRTGAF